jgi:hypothetical protein
MKIVESDGPDHCLEPLILDRKCSIEMNGTGPCFGRVGWDGDRTEPGKNIRIFDRRFLKVIFR